MIRHVLGSRASIGGVLGSGRGGAAAAQWYLAGGVSAANCVAAYQPIGAASLAASYTNLANPGTYTAAPGVAPTFDTATGWTFNGIGHFLDTGIIPASGWSMLVRFSSAATTAFNILVGSQAALTNRRFYLANANNPTNRVYGSGGALITGVSVASGVMAVCGQTAYYNGSSDGTVAPGWGGTTTATLTIGKNNIANNYGASTIQAVAIYDTTLTAPQVAAISSAMSALA